MTIHDRALRSQFFLSGPRPCPYLPDRRERKLFTNLSGGRASSLHDELAALGFRRSQTIAYRPACAGCNACVSTRVVARAYQPSTSQKRVRKRNADLVRSSAPPQATDEQFALFKRYLDARHAEGGMVEMDGFDYAAMVEDTPVRTRLVEYRIAPGRDGAGRLIAVCLTDLLHDGLSLVYSFFDPDEEKRSLGQFMIIDHIEMANAIGLPYVYLGYWVAGSPKMDYKIRFRPAEVLSADGWRAYESNDKSSG